MRKITIKSLNKTILTYKKLKNKSSKRTKNCAFLFFEKKKRKKKNSKSKKKKFFFFLSKLNIIE